MPWAIGSGAISAIGYGLVSTFSPSTTIAKWIGYQILLGVGRGSGMQIVSIPLAPGSHPPIFSNTWKGIIAVQGSLRPDQIPVSMAFLLFVQSFAGAIAIVIGTTIFTQSLVSGLAKYAPSVSPEAALAAGGGAQAVRGLVPEGSKDLGGVLKAYSEGVDHVFYLLVGFAVLTFIFSWGMGWKDLRENKGIMKKENVKKEGSEPV